MATKKNLQSSPAIFDTEKVELERANFRSLLIANPNYFGTLVNSTFKPIKKIASNTGYEELTCVGYNPTLDLLEATVQIKRANGYGGDLCSAGTREYVRFFINYGSGWQDVGVASFNVHDIPTARDCAEKTTKPLSYVVTLPHQPKRDACGQPVLPLVRAILSWNAIPTAGDPNYPVVWGNRLDKYIQIAPRQQVLDDFVNILSLSAGKKLQLPTEFEHAKFEPIVLPEPPELAVAQLAKLYDSKEKEAVPAHRYGLQSLSSVTTSSALNEVALASKISEFKVAGIDWEKVVVALDNTKGNTTYEELCCLGLDYNQEWLVATINVKKPSGYSGSLCTKGSTEHVSFWADWDNTCKWQFIGTRELQVHDISKIPADGLHYWVGLPVNLSKHREPCEKPKIGNIRAVLSWNVAPSDTDPNAIPHWGNRLDAHIEIKPGKTLGLIDTLGGIPVNMIDVTGNGMTLSGAVFAQSGSPTDSAGRHCPFGGVVDVQAVVPSDFNANGYKYCLKARKKGTLIELPITDSFYISDSTFVTLVTPDPVTGIVPYFHPNQNVFNMLGSWRTHIWGNDMLEIKLEMFDSFLNPLGATAWHRVQLDNKVPDAAIAIDAGGDCKDFTKGASLTGHFVARDEHFGSFRLLTLPSSLSPAMPVTATPVTNPTALPPGDSWTLSTAGMSPCGYVVMIEVWDRTIVNSRPNSHNYNKDDTGFCLRA